MAKDGGTKFWCEHCSQICPFFVASDLLVQPHNGLYVEEGIPFRRRRRVCTHCSNEIFTAELHEDYLEELVNLRTKILDTHSALDELNSRIRRDQERLLERKTKPLIKPYRKKKR
jgi:hypothetical protein